MTEFISQNAESFSTSLEKYSINTPLRIAHFLAQVAHESNNFKRLRESLNYSPAGIIETFGKSKAVQYAYTKTKPANQQAIANIVYGGRLGNIYPGDGWLFRGRGLIQLTGRENYENYKKFSGIDVVANPELATDPKIAIDIACWFWTHSPLGNLNKYADKDDVTTVTLGINGKKKKGLAERKTALIGYKSLAITLDNLKKKSIA